jgi:hypothetical protein
MDGGARPSGRDGAPVAYRLGWGAESREEKEGSSKGCSPAAGTEGSFRISGKIGRWWSSAAAELLGNGGSGDEEVTGTGGGCAAHPGEADRGDVLLRPHFMSADSGKRRAELCSATPIGAGERGAGKLGRRTMAAARAREAVAAAFIGA